MAGEESKTLGTAKVDIRAKLDKLDADLNGAKKKVEGLGTDTERTTRRMNTAFDGTGRRVQALGSTIGGLGMKLTIAAAGLTALAGIAVKSAMDAVESENLFSVALGGMADDARKWSEQYAKALRLDPVGVRKDLAMLYAMTSSMGLAEDAALDMSEGVVALTRDMASFYDLSFEQAMLKVRGGLTGESEPLKQLGIIVNETTVKLWAQKAGWIGVGQELSETGKVAARYNVILEATAAAQGDLSRTADSPANKLRALGEQAEIAKRKLGEMILPTVSNGLTWLVDTGIPTAMDAIDNLTARWTEMSEEGQRRTIEVALLFLASGPLMQGLGISLKGVGILISAFERIPGRVKWAILAAVPFLEWGYNLLKGLNDMVLGIRENVGSALASTPGFEDIGQNILGDVAQSRALQGPVINWADQIMNKPTELMGAAATAGADAAFDALDAKSQEIMKNITGGGDFGSKVWLANLQKVNDAYGDIDEQTASTTDAYKKMEKPLDAVGDAGADAGKQAAAGMDEAREAMQKLRSSVSGTINALKSLRDELRGEDMDENIKRLEAGIADPSGPWRHMIPDSIAMMSAEDKERWIQGQREASEKAKKQRAQAAKAVEAVTGGMEDFGIDRLPTMDELTQILSAGGITLDPKLLEEALANAGKESSWDTSIGGKVKRLFNIGWNAKEGKWLAGGTDVAPDDAIAARFGGGATTPGGAAAAGDLRPQGDALGKSFANGFLGPINEMASRVTLVFQTMFDNVGVAIGEAIAAYNASVAGQANPMNMIAMPKIKPFQPVPSFDTGGLVTRTGLALVHAGEPILPAGKAALGSITISHLTVNASGASEGRAAGAAFVDTINAALGGKVQKRTIMGNAGLSAGRA